MRKKRTQKQKYHTHTHADTHTHKLYRNSKSLVQNFVISNESKNRGWIWFIVSFIDKSPCQYRYPDLSQTKRTQTTFSFLLIDRVFYKNKKINKYEIEYKFYMHEFSVRHQTPWKYPHLHTHSYNDKFLKHSHSHTNNKK